jgi:hypothetical protein
MQIFATLACLVIFTILACFSDLICSNVVLLILHVVMLCFANVRRSRPFPVWNISKQGRSVMLIHSIWQSHWQVLTLVDAFTIRTVLITLTGMATIRQAIAHHPVYKSDIRSIWGLVEYGHSLMLVIVLQLSWLFLNTPLTAPLAFDSCDSSSHMHDGQHYSRLDEGVCWADPMPGFFYFIFEELTPRRGLYLSSPSWI